MTPLARDRVVAIDGPSGSGKSTVGREVARHLTLPVLDTGAMYRAVTLAVLESATPTHDGAACARVAEAARVDVEHGVTRLDGRDVSAEIRGPEVTAAVSEVSAHPALRDVLVARQRQWVATHGGGVVEGRDIGTVVFPDAAVKVFLVASDDERARRRQRDEEAAARPADVAEVRDAMARRDHLDSSRASSPLRPADDAVVIDTTARAVDEVVAEIVDRFRVWEGAR
ncbi:MAG TPA: (d)CMP kinase [Acidimicrobiia bacterium]|nr:(d)CMP kinase [Acidimicrobiia bacterium]